ncbi:NADP-dependent oxidoreductase [Microbacterium indicum]|uniref:NADP-dependent oxidoreductase n=1 Tax=Microbacterium indicum TaxID=358100 RepID=UPI00048A6BC7|nr:NADP-dependent oxidoreductase [Microbacterium indicum]
MSRAVRHDSFGGVEVLEVRDVPEPHAGPGEVRVRVGAVGLNAMDPWLVGDAGMAGAFGLSLPGGFAADLAGVVDEVGEGAVGFAVGDRVFGGVIGRSTDEYVVLPVGSRLWHTPDGVSDAEAAALPVAGATAAASVEAVAPGPGDTVLVTAAAGGVGVFAAQLAADRGARVIGTASPATSDFLRGLGVDPVAYGEGLEGRIREIAPGGVDAVIDAFSADTAIAAVAWGVAPERITTVLPGRDLPAGVHQRGATDARPEALDELAAAIAAGRIRVPIARRFPLAEVREAAALQLARHVHGKIVLEL